MSKALVSIDDFINEQAERCAEEGRELYNAWAEGRVYISQGALYAMARRFQELKDRDVNRSELVEFGRLYTFFFLMKSEYDANIAEVAIAFCNELLGGDE